MKRAALVAVIAATAAAVPAHADRVYLRGGGVLEGQVLSERDGLLEIEVGPGRVKVPMSRVDRVSSGASALAVYRSRAAALGARDVRGWLALADWAREAGLLTQAREAYERVLALDPDRPEANEALGRVLLAGRWVGRDEAMRARGYVSFEGLWITPAERGAILSERAAAARERDASREAEARVREAEARARAAEAEARRAEADARAASAATSGIPYDWAMAGGAYPPVYGPGGYVLGAPVVVAAPPIVVVEEPTVAPPTRVRDGQGSPGPGGGGRARPQGRAVPRNRR